MNDLDSRILGRCVSLTVLTLALFEASWAQAEPQPGAAPEFETAILPYFQTYCLRCHSEQKQEGNFRLDTLGATLSTTWRPCTGAT